jgi:aspartate/tyrosine/aromatic aminotransferase
MLIQCITVSRIVRQQYSNPPRHGAEIVATCLRSPAYYQQWCGHLTVMSGRIIDMRRRLFDELVALKVPGSWHHIIDQTGMFTYTGLSKEQVARLTEKHHVYLTSDGRISMAGLNAKGCQYLARAIGEVVAAVPEHRAKF